MQLTIFNYYYCSVYGWALVHYWHIIIAVGKACSSSHASRYIWFVVEPRPRKQKVNVVWARRIHSTRVMSDSWRREHQQHSTSLFWEIGAWKSASHQHEIVGMERSNCWCKRICKLKNKSCLIRTVQKYCGIVASYTNEWRNKKCH